MAYTINKTDGTAITTITDGTSDNTTTLQLFGKSFSGFGEGLNENLVKLLENSASTSAPPSPLKGELWFDTATNRLKIYDGTSFKPTGGAKTSASAPANPSAGDLWHDSTNDQLYVHTGSAFLLVGPVYTKGMQLSGWKIEILGSSGGNKVVSSMYAGNTRVAILSLATFTPSVTQTGFANIKAGITLNSTLGAVFEGSSTQAATLNTSDTTNASSPGETLQGGANFLRSNAADTTTGALTIDNDTGLIVGDAQELTVSVSSNNVTVAQTAQDKNLSFTINDGGVTKTPLAFTGSTGAITMSGATAITGDVAITGNLTISGSYDKSSVDVSTYTDTFIEVNSGQASDVDGGLIVEQASSVEARIFWDTSAQYWAAGKTGAFNQVITIADATDDGGANHSKVLKASSAGGLTLDSVTLAAVGSDITSSTSGSTRTVPSIGQVQKSLNLWGGSVISDDGSNSIAGNRYVETSAPTSGQGSNGDLWFVREA